MSLQPSTRRWACALSLLALALPVDADGVPLPAYNVEVNQTSVSGLSSGGYMAVQMHVAFSSLMKGAGIIAAGPYNCAQGNLSTALTACTTAQPGPPNPQTHINITDQRAGAGDVDPTSYLRSQKVYLFSGTLDTTVRPLVMNALNTYYGHYVSSGNVFYENRTCTAADDNNYNHTVVGRSETVTGMAHIPPARDSESS